MNTKILALTSLSAMTFWVGVGCDDDNCSKTLTCDVGDDDEGVGAGSSTSGAGGMSSTSTSAGQGGGGTSGSGGQGGTPVVSPTSCQAQLVCGSESCCTQVDFAGGTYEMGRSSDSGAPDFYSSGYPEELPEHSATVGPFSVDKYEVTVGRFRAFVDDYAGSTPPSGSGSAPGQPQSGWQSAWNAALPSSRAGLEQLVACPTDAGGTWTTTVGPNETLPINCVTWFVAFAFCVWDGGRLPTEAEWEFMAAGAQDRLYPWGGQSPAATRTSFSCSNTGDNTCDLNDLVEVHSLPLGTTPEGVACLAGNVGEWVLDYYDADFYQSGPCVDCVNQSVAPFRAIRGGSYLTDADNIRSASRWAASPDQYISSELGFRCARD